MSLEKERKFKLLYLPDDLTGVKIYQAYIMFDDSKQLRVRLKNGKAYLTYKSKTDDILIRNEYEYEIPYNDGKELYESSKYRIEKTRYSTTHRGNHIDIDIYADGLQICEIEYVGVLYGEDIPPYCGDDISIDYDYSNLNIAIKNSLL